MHLRRKESVNPCMQLCVCMLIVCVEEACQTGGPLVACGPIGCSMWPAWIFYDPYTIENYNNLKTFKAISSIPGVNFTNVLQAAFAPVDPKSVKRYS